MYIKMYSRTLKGPIFSKSALVLALVAFQSQAATNRPDGYSTICKTNDICSVGQTTKVAFGASRKFVYKVLSGSFSCSAGTFGSDPIPTKSIKECSVPSGVSSSTGGSAGDSSVSTVALTGAAGDRKVSLTWSDAGTGSPYQIYYDTDANPKGRSRLAIVSPSVQSYTASNLINRKSYWFWVKFLASDGTYHNSSAFKATPAGSSSGGNPTDGVVVGSESEILSAIATASAGDIIYIRAGTYYFDDTIEIDQSGSASNPIKLSKYPGDSGRPLFDFSSMSERSSNRGLELGGNYWYIYGIDVQNAGDNGMFISGSNNTIEFSTFSRNSDTGLQLGNGASHNLIKNVDSYFNADSTLENADGFAAKLDVGSGNKFEGCRAWNNLDDGFDGYLRGANNVTTTYENTWAIRNGYDMHNNLVAGDGNGFKTGGSDTKDLKHNAIYINTIAAGNSHDGYDHNSNRGKVTIYNAIAHQNGRNISFSNSNSAQQLIVKNTISYDGHSGDSLKAGSTNISNNSWQSASTDSNDFSSINIDDLLAPRKADGSLPDVDYFHLIRGSDLIDAGVNVGRSYNGSAPDIGAFESH
ncbi:hypothetical protein BTA51_26345 [Hahella sp. CCB-MM4]|uniref:right-handed parallel beta-helix repeat-containing protein n=1 Tax=Hahella sp. (strain CCB-MM4) TaxID=1926491 RepID=UPI000BC6CD1E|nr:right-handed parallel beta-helix repeat-containing protein [Hahella sp. CCB-MM4]OZG70364.1 hypothetical protein BTA51_26345 [Hahella sp. CCB-MM4]